MPRVVRRLLRAFHGPQRRDRLFHVLGRLELRVEHVPHHALAIDDEGHPPGEEAECRRHAVLLAHRAAPVGEQEERQLVLGGEFLVRRLAVGADPDHLGAGVLQVLVLVTEGTGFLGAPRRVVLRVEVEDDGLLAAVVGQPDRATVPIRKGEIRRAIADVDSRIAATEKVEECHGRRDSTKAKGGQPRPWPPRPGEGWLLLTVQGAVWRFVSRRAVEPRTRYLAAPRARCPFGWSPAVRNFAGRRRPRPVSALQGSRDAMRTVRLSREELDRVTMAPARFDALVGEDGQAFVFEKTITAADPG